MDALNPAKRRAAQRPTPQRVYVKVTSEFDATGYMQPLRHHLGGWPHLCHRRGAGFPPRRHAGLRLPGRLLHRGHPRRRKASVF